MNILVVCTQGQNRSRYLAQYLQSKGFNANFGGIDMNGANPIIKEQVEKADIIIAVREHIKDKVIDLFDVGNKKLINLEVKDNPLRFDEKAQELAKKSWLDFQEKYVYSELRKQIEPFLHEFN